MNVRSRSKSRWELFILSLMAAFLFSGCSTLTMEIDAPEDQPGVRTQMEATDPTTVSLTNGQPQLVKFFAFW